MRSDSPFVIQVADLIRRRGVRRAGVIEAPVEWKVEMTRVDPHVPMRADVVLEGIEGGIVATGEATVRAIHTCHRCLREFAGDVVVEFTELIGPDGDYPITEERIDLEQPVLDAVVVEFPLVPQCRSDCAGLCGTCGADLNAGACPGHDEEPDSPFASLHGLLDP